MIDKLNIEEIKPSSRRYPAIIFEQDREAGDQILNINNLCVNQDNTTLFDEIDLNLVKEDSYKSFRKKNKINLKSEEDLIKLTHFFNKEI